MSTETTVHPLLPHLVTPLPGPKASQIIERDNKVLSPSYTRGYPFVMARGEGAVVEDVDGNRFLISTRALLLWQVDIHTRAW